MPGFNLQEFISSIHTRGVLRDNKFGVRVMAPPMLANFSASRSLSDLTFRCDRTSLPAIDLLTENIRRYGYGPTEKVPYYPGFQDITADFIEDKNATVFTFFNLWFNGIVSMDMQSGILSRNPQTRMLPYEVRYKSEYTSKVHMFVYNDDTEKAIEWTLEDTYPLVLHSTPLSWSNENQFINMQVTFTYRNAFMKTLNRGDLPATLIVNRPPETSNTA